MLNSEIVSTIIDIRKHFIRDMIHYCRLMDYMIKSCVTNYSYCD